jgi:hypothetical protein
MRSRILLLAAIVFGINLVVIGPLPASGQDAKPQPPPCVHDVTVEKLGQAMPPDQSGLALVLLRVTIAPGGSIEAHTHPGTVVAVIQSGVFEYTMLHDSDQAVTRAASDGTPAASEPVTHGEAVTLNPGDGFSESTGMVHSASNPGDEPNQPFTQCVEDSAVAGH